MIFSSDSITYFKSISYDTQLLLQHNDDVILSLLLTKNRRALTHLPMLFWENDTYISTNDCRNAIFIRIKHCEDRQKDIEHWKFCLSVIDSI
jgi:hypothetical protein